MIQHKLKRECLRMHMVLYTILYNLCHGNSATRYHTTFNYSIALHLGQMHYEIFLIVALHKANYGFLNIQLSVKMTYLEGEEPEVNFWGFTQNSPELCPQDQNIQVHENPQVSTLNCFLHFGPHAPHKFFAQLKESVQHTYTEFSFHAFYWHPLVC